MKKINKELKKYIEEKILTLYDDNIGGHGIDHINTVINRSFELVEEFNLDVDLNMVYVISAFHDIGYKTNPDEHEEVSSEMFKNNSDMRKYFDEKQITTIAEAIIDHRASLEYEARSIYGKIVSSADREISVENMLQRSILFQSDKHKKENPTIMQIIDYSYQKLSSKYGKSGYAKMYFQDKKYIDYLNRMQEILEDKDKFIEAELEIIKKLKLDANAPSHPEIKLELTLIKVRVFICHHEAILTNIDILNIYCYNKIGDDMANKEKGTNWFVKFILKSLGQEKCDELMFFATDVIDRDFTEFTSVTEIEEVLTSRVHEFMASGTLTEEELFYLKFYTGYEFKNINNTMRNTWNYEENGLLTEEKKQHYHKMGDIITRAVRKFPSLSMNIKTYRGVSLRAFHEYGITSIEDLIHLEGNYLYEAGFSSTSLLKNTSYFNKDLDYRDNCNIEIEYSIPAESQDGFPLLSDDLSYSKSQLEYLINSGSLSRVHKVEVNPTTNTAKLSVVLIPKSLWDPLELEQEKQQTFIPS